MAEPMPVLPLLEPRRRVTWLDLLTIAVVTVAVMMPVFRTGFSPLDDFVMIQNNDAVTQPSWEGFKSFWAETSFRIYMPLALSVWQMVSKLTQHGTWGKPDFMLPPLGFKIVSVATHAAAAAAAAWGLSTLTRTRWPAIIGALVFAVHPVQVESVAWTTGLKDELCGLFSILAIGLYARHAERNPAGPWADGWWWAALAAALGASFSKPTAMVLPVTLLTADWAMRRCDVVRRVLSVGPFLLPAIAVAMVIFSVQGNSNLAPIAAHLRPLVAGDTYAFYFGKVIWPTGLTIDYGRRPAAILQSGAIWWTWTIPLAALVAVLATRSRWWVLAAVLFVVPVLPVSGLTSFDMQQYSTVTDHYLYQPLFGVGLAVALAVRRWPTAAGLAAVLAVAALATQTYRTATDWERGDQFCQRILQANPQSWLARELLASQTLRRGDLMNTRRLTEETLSAHPDSGGSLDYLSVVQMRLGHYRESAETGLKAAAKSAVKRIDLARRITFIGAFRLYDLRLTREGLKYWLSIEPNNAYAADMMRVVQRETEREAATQAANRPATSPPTTRP